jgi:bifunctional N-acetylglucosamine-1-phosphate-uridyltransferase/glucosamine-1-phosphate-acetyltransferase GlmU-like protein
MDRNTKDHNKKAYPRQFHEGEWVLLDVKNFESNNKKLSEFYKGPYIFVKVNKNNTVLLKKKSGTHEYLYNTEIIKHYYEQSKKVVKEQIQKEDPTTESSSSPPPSQQKKCKEDIREKTPDEGTTLRSKTATSISPNIIYGD